MNSAQEAYYAKLKNRLFGCLCEREAGREWEKNLDSILIELYGIPDDQRTINYYRVFYKLSACRFLNFETFLKTIFDVMNLLGR